MKGNDPIRKLAVHGASAAEVPPKTLEKARDLFIDSMGCIYGGSRAAGVDEVLSDALLFGGAPQASVFARSVKTSAPEAAFVNAVMMHARDYDDTHDPAVNHGCVTVLSAMAAAVQMLAAQKETADSVPSRAVSGTEFLTSLAVALDVANRIALSLIPYLHVGWLPTTIGGPFGAACGVGRLLGLDTDKMQNAFGFAYAQVHGNRQALIEGTLAKRIQPGFSAAAGLRAAFLARHGLTAGNRIMEGAYGLPVLYTGGKADTSRVTGSLGLQWETDNISIKPYPSCRCTHPVIDGALKIRNDQGISTDRIQSGTIMLPPASMGQIGNPFTIRGNPTVDAQFSAQYTAALAFVNGGVTLKDFEPDRIIREKKITGLAGRFVTREFSRDSSTIVPVEMRVELKNGKSISCRIEHPLGSPENPISEEQLTGKLKDNLNYSAISEDKEKAEQVISILRSAAEAEDMAEIFSRLP